MTDLSHFTLADLAHRCRQETGRFFRQLKSDDRFCFELIRRAVQEEHKQAWQLVIEQYQYEVAGWVKRHALYEVVDEEIDYFVNEVFFTFWRAFRNDVNKLDRFPDLKRLLVYLRLCTHTAVHGYVERRMNPEQRNNPKFPNQEVDDSNNPADKVARDDLANEIWQCVLEVVNTEQERLIAEAYLIYDMKPKEIYQAHPDAFANVKQVRRIKDDKLLPRLRRNKKILAFLEGDG